MRELAGKTEVEKNSISVLDGKKKNTESRIFITDVHVLVEK